MTSCCSGVSCASAPRSVALSDVARSWSSGSRIWSAFGCSGASSALYTENWAGMAQMSASASLNDATVILDDRPVLRGVSIAIGPGLTVLRGPNGAGKTTLLRALAGLAPLARGSRRVGSTPLFIGQRSMLLRGLNAHQNLTFLSTFRGARSADVTGALVRWGLGALLD